MSDHQIPKRPRIEAAENEKEEAESGNRNFAEQTETGQEEILSVLIEHRTKEVEHLRQRVDYYQSKLDHTERSLEDAKDKLAHLRGCEVVKDSEESVANGRRDVNFESYSANIRKKSPGDNSKKSGKRSSSPLNRDEEATDKQLQSKPRLVVPSLPSNTSQPIKTKVSGIKAASASVSGFGSKPKGEKALQSKETAERRLKETKVKPVQREHKDLIPSIAKSSSSVPIRCQSGSLLSSQHKRKLRSLVLCPTNDQLFVTSALDGAINLWQVQGKGSSATLLSTTDCQSEKQRRWPEDLAFHPLGKKIVSVYTADGGDSQTSVLNLNKGKEKTRVKFLKEKPHVKGIINGVSFMPWDTASFVTGGSDHAVIIWKAKDRDGEEEEEESWKPKSLHRSIHSSAVMGVAGMNHKSVVMSAGADKRIVGFDVESGRTDYSHQIDSKCMSILPNPSDFNLFMVQTGTPEKQLRLFDRRLRQMEVHAFGWKQESSESQSALINQAWSPDGLYITSGSADPVIHVFDIRHNARRPSQSIRAHHKRVFKAAWHHALPLLISISSDLNVGLHKIV